MGGIFGVAKKDNCIMDLFFGTDYHSHLGTRRAGMAVYGQDGFNRSIHNIENSPFRTKFEDDVEHLSGRLGIGSISDSDPQPLLVKSHLGSYALVTVGRVNNEEALIQHALDDRYTHFLEMSGGHVNTTELIATIIDKYSSFKEGIEAVQNLVDGSMTLLIMTKDRLIAARDRLGRTPLVIGKREDARCVSMEDFAYVNLGYTDEYELGPAEIVSVTSEGYDIIKPAEDTMQICAFLWCYYGYPTSTYEGVNVEAMRYKNGAAMANFDLSLSDISPDHIAGVPDSGIAHAIGYANRSRIPFARPFIKYTPTWPRSFMPAYQTQRNLIARMKLIPVEALIRDKKLLLIDDSIVRGTQLRETTAFLFKSGAKEVHVRPACPPILFGCPFLNFSRERHDFELITRRTINKLEGRDVYDMDTLKKYAQPETDAYRAMIEDLRTEQNFTTLRYQRLTNLVNAIGLPKEKLCTYCWDGVGNPCHKTPGHARP